MSNCQDLEPLLTPYVDGEATAEQRAAIEAHLAACASCRDCAEAEKHARELVHACKAQLLTPAPARLHRKCAELADQSRVAATTTAVAVASGAAPRAASSTADASRPALPIWRRWAPMSLVATVALVVAGVFGYSLLSNRGTALAAQLASDHIRCVGIVGDRAPADPATSQTNWKQRAGWTVDVPTFPPGDELQFVQLRRCLHGEGILMGHILYRRRGRLVSLFVMPEREPSHREIVIRGQRTVIWSQGGRTYAVVGANSSDELQELADRFSRALP
jgi:anti-sigma factor RsiW